MKIVLHIERLVLEGLPPGTDVARMQAAFERELQAALAEDASRVKPAHTLATEGAPGRPVELAGGPDAIGQQIARAAYANIGAAHSFGRPPATGVMP